MKLRFLQINLLIAAVVYIATILGNVISKGGTGTDLTAVNSVVNADTYLAAAGKNLNIANNVTLGASQVWTVISGRKVTSVFTSIPATAPAATRCAMRIWNYPGSPSIPATSRRWLPSSAH